MAYNQEEALKLYPKMDKDGRRYTTVPIHAPGETKNGRSAEKFKGMLPPPGRHWRTDVERLNTWDKNGLIEWSSRGNPRKKNFMDEMRGKKIQDIWTYKDPLYPKYPTEKNAEMLDMIIKASSNEDSIVLDCFCGSGSTLYATGIHGRSWIGIDQSEEAIRVTRSRFDSGDHQLFDASLDYQYIEIGSRPSSTPAVGCLSKPPADPSKRGFNKETMHPSKLGRGGYT